MRECVRGPQGYAILQGVLQSVPCEFVVFPRSVMRSFLAESIPHPASL